MADGPLFDNTRKALVFALNANEVEMPKPGMTASMAEGIKPKLPRGKKAREAFFAKAAERREAERDALVRAAFRRRDEVRGMKGVNRAAQAGFILQEFAKLDDRHQTVLTGLLVRSHRPCACRRPCCSGWAVDLRWAKAVEDTCLLLKEAGDVLRVPGKRGLSTQPALRRAVVLAFYKGTEPTLVELAALAECSQITAAKHRAWIAEYLKATETEAWQEIASLFDRVGITGAFLD